MHRRSYLRALAGLGGVGGLAGCLGAPRAGRREPPASPPLPSDAALPVPEDELVHAVGSAIPAIVDPAFGPDWQGLDLARGPPSLRDGHPVIGVERGGRARAYPLGVLRRHEVVNDWLGDPLLVTYCRQCGSGMAAVRRVGGRETRFEVPGILWRSNLLVRDGRTRSLWSQLLGRAVRGPATGRRLELVPSTLTTWGPWRRTHPDGAVLLPPPHSPTTAAREVAEDYSYGRYGDSSPAIGRENGDRRLVVGVTSDGAARAYPYDAVAAAGVVNDAVGSRPVVVAVAPGGSLVAYDRRVDGRTLRFGPAGGGRIRGGGSTWRLSAGRAIGGALEGTELRPAAALPPLFLRAWRDFHPATTVYG